MNIRPGWLLSAPVLRALRYLLSRFPDLGKRLQKPTKSMKRPLKFHGKIREMVHFPVSVGRFQVIIYNKRKPL